MKHIWFLFFVVWSFPIYSGRKRFSSGLDSIPEHQLLEQEDELSPGKRLVIEAVIDRIERNKVRIKELQFEIYQARSKVKSLEGKLERCLDEKLLDSIFDDFGCGDSDEEFEPGELERMMYEEADGQLAKEKNAEIE